MLPPDQQVTEPKKPATEAQVMARIATARPHELWMSEDGVAHATIDRNGHHEHVGLRSARFKALLVRAFHDAREKPPGGELINAGITFAEAHALDGEVYPTPVRIAPGYVDLVDEAWRAIEVDAEGWRIVERPPVKFRRTPDMRPLPEPVGGGSLDELQQFVNVADEDWPLVKAWLIGSIASSGPYAVLAFCGEQGSAKSTSARNLRSVVDPARTATRKMPSEDRDLVIAAQGSWIVALDNLSFLSQGMSDALSRLATGGGFGTRQLYSDDAERTFYHQRPIILNGIPAVATAGDLLSRAIVLELPPIARRRTEVEMDAAFTEAHPRILGALLDAAVQAIRNLDTTAAPDVRMADFARWVEASGASPGFLDRYAANQSASAVTEVNASPFAGTLYAFASENGGFEGTATQLLAILDNRTEHGQRGKHWPATAQAAANQLRRHAPALRRVGLEVDDRKRGGRTVYTVKASRNGSSAAPDEVTLHVAT